MVTALIAAPTDRRTGPSSACRLTVYGGIKTGVKRLFIRVETGAFCEIQPTCVLDFYVHEQYQRLGKQLFEVINIKVQFPLATYTS